MCTFCETKSAEMVVWGWGGERCLSQPAVKDAYPQRNRLCSPGQGSLPALCWFLSPHPWVARKAHWQPLHSPRHQTPLEHKHTSCTHVALQGTMLKGHCAAYGRFLPICSSLWPTSGSPQYTTSPNASYKDMRRWVNHILSFGTKCKWSQIIMT